MSALNKFALRDQLMQKQGGLCYYCSCEMRVIDYNNKKVEGNIATFEHLYDQWSPQGKIDSHRHVVLACSDCNTARGSARCKMAFILVMKSFETDNEFKKCISESGGVLKRFRKLALWQFLGDYPKRNVDIDPVRQYTTWMEVAK